MLRPCPEKVTARLNAERPQTKKQVRSFLGLIGFLRAFVPKFAEIAAPLTELTKNTGKNQVKWGQPQEEAYLQLRNVLTVQLILKMADLSKPFIVQVDASEIGLGAVLLQEENGTKRPVAYASRKLKSSEKLMLS